MKLIRYLFLSLIYYISIINLVNAQKANNIDSLFKILIIKDEYFINNYLFNRYLSDLNILQYHHIQILSIDSIKYLHDDVSIYKAEIKFTNDFFSDTIIKTKIFTYYIGINNLGVHPLFGFYKSDILFLWNDIYVNGKLNKEIKNDLRNCNLWTNSDARFLIKTLRVKDYFLNSKFSTQCNYLVFYFPEDRKLMGRTIIITNSVLNYKMH